MKSIFGPYANQAEDFISKVAAVTGAPEDLERAERIVCSFFQVIRERISPQESMQLVAQLPMLLKALYVDGWKMAHKSEGGKTLDDFIYEVKAKYGPAAGIDLGSNSRTEIILKNTIGVLRNFVSDGELKDIRAQMPEEIAELFKPMTVL